MPIPTCIITGRIVGDRFACGDCDPCAGGPSAVPDVVKHLMSERDEWMDRYEIVVAARRDRKASRTENDELPETFINSGGEFDEMPF